MSALRIALPSAVFIACAALSAQAETVRSVSANYNIDVGPVTMTEVKYRLNLNGGAINSRARIESKGISRVFSEYSAKVEAESVAKGSAIAPQSFHLVRQRDDNTREAKLRWTADGIDYAPREKRPERRARIDNALNDEMADPMTVVLRIGTAGKTPCPTVQQVFDGRDVFELSLTDKGSGELDGEQGYRGPVRHCVVSWTPIAGRAAEKNEPRESYDVSFAPIGELPSGQTLWLPVALSGKLKGLPFNAYVTKLSAEGGANKAANQN
ncbi:MAG: DUF3108 domain-containing protein [Aestuariivirga sp.]|nr:DUF3108 domain-containing protein [Aestuariivirga sp.]